jgi:hypothetical protein
MYIFYIFIIIKNINSNYFWYKQCVFTFILIKFGCIDYVCRIYRFKSNLKYKKLKVKYISKKITNKKFLKVSSLNAIFEYLN